MHPQDDQTALSRQPEPAPTRWLGPGTSYLQLHDIASARVSACSQKKAQPMRAEIATPRSPEDVAGLLRLHVAAVDGRVAGEAAAAGLLAAVVGVLCSSASWMMSASALCALLQASGNTATPCRCMCDACHDSCACISVRCKCMA